MNNKSIHSIDKHTFLSINLLCVLIVASGMVGLISCQNNSTNTPDHRVKVIATTSMVGDIVSAVGGEFVSVDVLFPLGTDPHSFSPSPRMDAVSREYERLVKKYGWVE